jgi:hypothetical protein
MEDQWGGIIRELIVAKNKEIDKEFERKFSGNDVNAFQQRFKDLAAPISQTALAAFRIAAWTRGDSEPSSAPNRPPDSSGDSEAERRRAAVSAYIEEAVQKTGKRIKRTDIWKAVGYKTRTEFERWERNDRRATKTAHQRFTRFLTEKPHLK